MGFAALAHARSSCRACQPPQSANRAAHASSKSRRHPAPTAVPASVPRLASFHSAAVAGSESSLSPPSSAPSIQKAGEPWPCKGCQSTESVTCVILTHCCAWVQALSRDAAGSPETGAGATVEAANGNSVIDSSPAGGSSHMSAYTRARARAHTHTHIPAWPHTRSHTPRKHHVPPQTLIPPHTYIHTYTRECVVHWYSLSNPHTRCIITCHPQLSTVHQEQTGRSPQCRTTQM